MSIYPPLFSYSILSWLSLQILTYIRWTELRVTMLALGHEILKLSGKNILQLSCVFSSKISIIAALTFLLSSADKLFHSYRFMPPVKDGHLFTFFMASWFAHFVSPNSILWSWSIVGFTHHPDSPFAGFTCTLNDKNTPGFDLHNVKPLQKKPQTLKQISNYAKITISECCANESYMPLLELVKHVL